MLLKRKSMKGIFFVVLLYLFSANLNAQTEEIDTSGYIPFFYFGSLDYNLMIAASKGYDNEVKRLIGKGADVNYETAEGATALIFASANDHLSTVKTLISFSADVNHVTLSYETPLLVAVKQQNVDISEALIRSGANIDFQDNNGVAALHFASIYGYFYVTDLLLFYEADIDIKANDGTTPLMAAVWAGYGDIADLMVQNGANIEAHDNVGFNPFLIASQNGDTLLMNLLIKTGIDIYEKNIYNWDALSYTIRMNQLPATELLLKTARKWSPAKEVVDPYIVATKYRRKEIIDVLIKENVRGKVKKGFDQAGITLSSKFTGRDFYTGINLTFKEPFINGGLLVGVDTKFWYTRVLMKQDDNNYFQYLDKSSLAFIGLFKDISVTDNQLGGNFAFSGSLSVAYGFGNKLKGTEISPLNKIMIIPAAGFKWENKNISVNAGLEYTNNEFYGVGPLWIRLGLTYNYFFDKVRAPLKNIKWF